jgi:integrase
MLTDAKCRNATCPPERRQARFSDSGGLYLQVSPAGSKRWFLKYRTDGKEKQLALGGYPAVSLADARKARDAAKLQKAQGADPVQTRQFEKLKASVGSGNTLNAVAADWLALNKPNWSDTHYVREERNLRKDVLPFLGTRVIADIRPVELLAVIQKVEARSAPSVPGRVLITSHGVWCHAVATGRAERDITTDIKKALKTHIKGNFPAIIDPKELAELLRASLAYRGGPVVRAALMMAPLLFQRPLNLRTMRWADVDRDAGLWTIPSEDMKRRKAEKQNGQPHVVSLPRQALALLDGLHPLTGHGVYVFPGLRDHEKPMSEAGVNAALHAMGYKDRHTWHGYRTTGRTILRQVLKFPVDVLETQLAHKGQITHNGAYDRATHLEERTDMLQVWADYLDKLAAGADVLEFVRKRA